MSFGVEACRSFWSLGVFEVLILLWSLGLFPYPKIALMLALISSFCKRGALTRIVIVLVLCMMMCRIKMLDFISGMYGLLLWLFTQFVWGEEGEGAFQPLSSFLSSKLLTSLLENTEFPLSLKETIFLAFNLLSLFYTVWSVYKMKTEISRGVRDTPDLGVKQSRKNLDWSGKWEDMGQTLKEFSDPMDWDFPSDQIQNPVEVAKYLREKCHGNTKEERITAVSWALAFVYRTLLDTVEQQIAEREQGDKLVTTPVTQAAANLPGSRLAAASDSRPQTMAVAANTRGGKCKGKTDRKVEDDEDDDAGEGPSPKSEATSRGTESGANIDSFSLKDLRGLRKDYRRQPDESIISWLVRLWDAAGEIEGIKQLNTLSGLSENPSAVGLLKVEEQRVPIATSTVHRRQYRTNRDAVIPIHKMIRELESQGVVSKTHSPFNSPIWPVRKSDGEWRLTVDYRALNEVTPPLSAAVPDILELQYELESKAAKWYATIDIANAFFSIPLAAECRPQFAFTWRGVQYTWNRLPQGWKHSPTICHGLIQAALEEGEAPEHLQYIDDIIVWGRTAIEVLGKTGKTRSHIHSRTLLRPCWAGGCDRDGTGAAAAGGEVVTDLGVAAAPGPSEAAATAEVGLRAPVFDNSECVYLGDERLQSDNCSNERPYLCSKAQAPL
ncbi:uncharacterized protein VK521_007233 [Ammospiza maritima maritima]